MGARLSLQRESGAWRHLGQMRSNWGRDFRLDLLPFADMSDSVATRSPAGRLAAATAVATARERGGVATGAAAADSAVCAVRRAAAATGDNERRRSA